MPTIASAGRSESDAAASARFAETYDTSGDLVTTEVHVRAVHPPAPFAPEHAGPGGWGGTRDVGLDGEDLWTMPKWERVHRAKAAKERGVALFKAGRHRAALRAYDVAIRLLTAPFAPLDLSKVEMPEWDPPSERDPIGKDPHLKLAERYGSNAWRGLADSGLGEGNENQVLLKATILNASLAASRRGDHATCEWYCSKALAEDPMCVKGWFRRGRARVAMHRWDEAEDDLNRAERLQGDDEIAKELETERKKLAAGRKKSESGGAVAKAFRAVFGGGGGGAGEYPKPREMRRLVTGDLGIEAGPAHPTGRLDTDEPGAQLDELLDETSPHTRMEHAFNKALHYEQIGLNEFVDSGMPIELYSEAELAPVGEGHPTAQAVEKREYVVPFGEAEAAELDAEIAEREHDEELYDKMLNAAKRGNRVQRGTATHNPWDRDGTKAVDELNMQFVKEYNEQKMEEAKEEMEAHKKQWHERKKRATGDDIGLDWSASREGFLERTSLSLDFKRCESCSLPRAGAELEDIRVQQTVSPAVRGSLDEGVYVDHPLERKKADPHSVHGSHRFSSDASNSSLGLVSSSSSSWVRGGRRRSESRGHRPSRIAADGPRALTARRRARSFSLAPPRRGSWCVASRARAAVRSRRARSLLVHLLVLLPLDEVDDAGDGGGDLRIARGEGRRAVRRGTRAETHGGRSALAATGDTPGRARVPGKADRAESRDAPPCLPGPTATLACWACCTTSCRRLLRPWRAA